MSEPSSSPGAAPALLQGLVLQPLRRHWPLGLGVGGGLLLLEASHGPLSSLLSLAAASTGLWLLRGRLKPRAPQLPTSVAGWLERCEAVLASFERLQPAHAADAASQQFRRQGQLQRLRDRQDSGRLQLALVGSAGWGEQLQNQLLGQLRSPLPLQVHRSHPLPAASGQWHWPELFRHCDLVLYRLELPLKAVDLRWLEALPAGQAVRLLVPFLLRHHGDSAGEVSQNDLGHGAGRAKPDQRAGLHARRQEAGGVPHAGRIGGCAAG